MLGVKSLVLLFGSLGLLGSVALAASSSAPAPPPSKHVDAARQLQSCPNTCDGSNTCDEMSYGGYTTCALLEGPPWNCDCTGCSCPNDPSPSPPSPLPPHAPLPAGSRFVTTPSALVSALEDSTVSNIVVAVGQYDFSTSMSCPHGIGLVPPALCINNRNVIIVADGLGAVVLNAQGSAASHRMVLFVQSSTVELVGLTFTGGYNAGNNVRHARSKLARRLQW